MLKHLATFRTNSLARAIGVVFGAVGFLFGTWATLIPFVKDKFALDEAQLGMLLLLLPLGAAVANPLAVPMINKLGTVRATLTSLVFAALFIILPSNFDSIFFAATGLFLFGMGFSAVNIAMNTCATQFEFHEAKNIIATCHGLWSGGAMVGAAVAGLAYSKGAYAEGYVFGVAAIVVISGILVAKDLKKLPDEAIGGEAKTSTRKAFAKPNRALWILIIIGLCVNLGEGCMVDWSVVYAKEVLHSTGAVASMGFAVYSFFMMSGRLLGDGLITEFGGKKMLKWCGILMTIGYLITVFSPNIGVLFVGYALVGCGVSLGSPILYAASTKVPGLPKGAGLAVYNTYAMAGFLGGPVMIGFVAKAFSLPVGFAIVAFFSFLWVLNVKRMA